MRISRTEPARRAGSGAHAGRTGGGQDAEAAVAGDGRTKAARGPWAVLCAVVTVVLGPAAVTASALDRANAAPQHHTERVGRQQAHVPADPSGPRPSHGSRRSSQSSLKRSHSLG
ncbi:hypothetical protein ACH4S8_19675 [Streptomyces sp. NPDC021080]|uniref:hypothetical protein n=1 Tax=Streptomyces sp. NPDC021080 TaxID=3365110 RepID=UPI003798CCD9